LRWVALAFLPSSLLMAVTTHLTTNIAPVPLLWVVPLTLYLVSFILAFARWPEGVHRAFGRLLPMALLFLAFALLTSAAQPVAVVAGLHLGTFLVVALVCHGELARDRPSAAHLTEFYLWLSAGGVLGGLFNAILAPLVFRHAGLVEYPLVLVLAALVRPGRPVAPGGLRRADVLWPAALGLATAAAVLAVRRLGGPTPLPTAGGLEGMVRTALTFGLPAVLAYCLVDRPVRFALGLAALFLAGALDPGPLGRTLLTERNFFGVVRVTESPDGRFVRMVHGTTLHGQERTEAGQELRRVSAAAGALAATNPFGAAVIAAAEPVLRDGIDREPLTYYHRRGPIGQVFASRPGGFRSVAVVGLGTGAVAAYARPGQRFVFYEIDPAVARIARDPAYFTFLARAPREPEVIVGDARLQLERAADERFDLIVLDAFSSDAIPVHLLTREALRLYVSRLTDGGLLAFHVSNDYLDLPPLLARLGEDARPQLVAYLNDDRVVSEAAAAEGQSPSQWVVLARRPEDLGRMRGSPYWQPVRTRPETPLWTDDYSHLLGAWRREE
jgi:hypothetical protein